MITTATIKLLLVLLGAAFLGLLIGLSAMRLHYARKQKELYNEKFAAVTKLTAERDSLVVEKNNTFKALESERQRVRTSLEKVSMLSTQQDTLKAHTGLQTQRMEKLTNELHVSEEKCIRLQRDFASFKANKLREVRMLKVNSDEWLDNEELPVLSKRVGQESAGQNNAADEHIASERHHLQTNDDSELEVDLDSTQPIIASELDIPSLAESELPDSVEELEFEVADRDEHR